MPDSCFYYCTLQAITVASARVGRRMGKTVGRPPKGEGEGGEGVGGVAATGAEAGAGGEGIVGGVTGTASGLRNSRAGDAVGLLHYFVGFVRVLIFTCYLEG